MGEVKGNRWDSSLVQPMLKKDVVPESSSELVTSLQERNRRVFLYREGGREGRMEEGRGAKGGGRRRRRKQVSV